VNSVKKIIIDTNIAFSTERRLLQGFVTDVIQRMSGHSPSVGRQIQLVIPELVKEELVNQYREDFNKLKRSLLQLERKLRGLVLEDEMLRVSFPLDDEEVVRAYRHALEKRLTELKAKCPPYPQVSHGKVIQRCLQRRRPFQASGKGYQDTLIWESVLDEVLEGDEVVFVTNNKKDFMDKEGNLHPDLADDLKQLNCSGSSIQILSSLNELLKTVLLPELETADLQEWVDEGGLAGFWGEVVSKVELLTRDMLETDDSNISEAVGVPVMYSRLEDIRLNLEDPDPGIEVALCDETTAYALLETSVLSQIEFLFEKQYTNALRGREFVTVRDWDWTDRLALASGVFEVLFSATFYVDRKDRSVTDVHVGNFGLIPWLSP